SRGRLFESADAQNRMPVAIIDSIVARTHFGGEDPLGRRIAVPNARGARPRSAGELDWLTIVGVVEPIKSNELYRAPIGGVYRNYGELVPFWYGLVIKTSGDPLAIVPAAKQAVARVAPGVA